jgi:hypothetical protein
MGQTKFCAFNYESTGFLKKSFNNLLSIMLLGKDFLNFISNDFRKKKYENLINNKLIFFKKLSISK